MSWTMITSWLFLAVSLWGAWFTHNAYRPMIEHQGLSIVSFIAGFLITLASWAGLVAPGSSAARTSRGYL